MFHPRSRPHWCPAHGSPPPPRAWGAHAVPHAQGDTCAKWPHVGGMYLGWDSGTHGTAVGQEKGRRGESGWWGCVRERNGVGKSQRRAKRRAVTREISEGGARKTKQKVRIQKAGREIKKIHPARNSTSCQADSRCCLGKSWFMHLECRNRNTST